MAENVIVKCPYCGSYDTVKTKNGKVTRRLSELGSVVGGVLLEMVTGIPGVIGANAGMQCTWHQYYCRKCTETFKVRLDAVGAVKEIKK